MNNLINCLPGLDYIVDNTCNHQCSCCGNCCTEFIPITRKEVNVIKAYLKEHPEIKCNWLTKNDSKNLYVFCPFLNEETHRCDIYPVRPYVCRDFKCDRSKDKLNEGRLRYALRADYNSFVKIKDTFVSLHFLFFNDYNFDFNFRRLAIKQMIDEDPLLKIKFGTDNLSFEEQQKFIPMYVDTLLVKKGGE